MSKIKKLFGSGEDQDDEVMYGTPSKVSDSNPIHPAHADPGPKYSSERSGKFFEPSNDVNESPATATSSTQSGARFDTPGTAQQLEQPGGAIETQKYKTDDSHHTEEKKSGGIMGKLFHRKDKDTEHSTEHSTTEQGSAGYGRSAGYDRPGHQGHLQDDTHYGRDAGYAGAGALGAGAVGAGAYEYSKRDEDPRTHEQSQAGLRDDERYGHHDTKDDKHAHERSLEGLRDDQKYPVLQESHAQHPSHTDHGRDHGIAGATGLGVGAAAGGAGAYEYSKHNDDEERRRRQMEEEEKHKKSSGGGLGGLFHRKDKDTEHHDSSHTSRTEPTSSSRPIQDTRTDDTHYGRDAAIAGGATGLTGAAGYGAYEANKSRGTADDDVSRATYTERSYPIGSSTTTDPTTTSSTLPTRTDPMSTTTGTTTTTTTTTSTSRQPPTQQSSLGRDAGIGGAGVGTQQSSLGRDTAIGGTGAGTQDSHFGRDAAIGGAGLGAAGAGTYLAYENTAGGPHVPGEFPTEDGRDPHVPGSFPGSGVDQRDAYGGAPTSLQDRNQGSGLGSGAALGTAGTAGAGYGTYQATKFDGTPSDSRIERTAPAESYGQPMTSTTGAPGQAITTDEPHYGRDAAIAGGATGLAGAGGYGAYQATHRDDTTRGDLGTNTSSNIDDQKRDYGRDTAIAGGAAPETTSSGYDTLDRDTRTNQGGITSTEGDTHYGRDAAIAGGVGTAGAAGTYAGTRDTDDNRISESGGHSYLHKKSADQTGEKKPGFISKLLGRDKNKDENDVPTTTDQSREAATGSSSTGGAPLTQTRSEVAGGDPKMTDMLPVGDDGLIHLHKEGSHPDAPALVVREKADGSGLETTQQ